MISVMYRTPTELNGVGCEMRIIDMDGDQMIEVVALPKRKLAEKLKLIKSILLNKPVVCSSVIMDDKIKINGGS